MCTIKLYTMSKKPRVSTGARKKAEELGIDLKNVTGTGKDGLVTVKDVQSLQKIVEETPKPWQDRNAGHLEKEDAPPPARDEEFPPVSEQAKQEIKTADIKSPKVKNVSVPADPPVRGAAVINDETFFDAPITVKRENNLEKHLVRFSPTFNKSRIVWWTKGQVMLWYNIDKCQIIADNSECTQVPCLEFPGGTQIVLSAKRKGCHGCRG